MNNNPLAKYSSKYSKYLNIAKWALYIISVFAVLLAILLLSFSKLLGVFFFVVALFFWYIGKLYEKEVKGRAQKDNVLITEGSRGKQKAKTDDNSIDSITDRVISRVPKIGANVQLYSYIKVPIEEVDRKVVFSMFENNDWKCTLRNNNGKIELLNNERYVATLKRKGLCEMVVDWISRGDIIRCELTGIKQDQEHIFIAFYRDEEKRLSHLTKSVIRLTAYSATEKQDSISSLVGGEILSIKEDDYKDGVYNVLDWCDEPMGNLPAKYAKIHEEQSIRRVFFDHADYDDEKDQYIPYVRIYT